MPRKQKRGEFKSVEGDFIVNTVGKHARHAFVVPTYDKSPYLEECLASLASQQRQSAIHIATSTPFEGIRSVCDRYGASLFVHGPNRGIGADWNAALGGGNADLVTIAHQDDIYLRVFSEQVMAAAERYPDCGFYFTAVSEFEANGQRRAGSVNNWVKDMLSTAAFLGRKQISGSISRRILLGLGNAVNCPAVTINMKRFPGFRFREDMKTNLDWLAWIELSGKAAVCRVPGRLMMRRVHSESETAKCLDDGARAEEDSIVFSTLWPKPVASFLSEVYSLSYKGYMP